MTETAHSFLPARRRWRTVRRWFFAAVVALFPLLFILDERYDFPLSPVLPGIAALVFLWLVGPYLVTEVLVRKGEETTPERSHRRDRASKLGLGSAFAWFLLWLVLA